MSNDVTFDIVARDRASNTFSKVGKNAKTSESSIAKFGATVKRAFAVAVIYEGARKATSGLLDLAKAAAEDQVSVALLAKQYKNSAKATNGQIASTEKYITMLGRTKGIADDVARGSLGTLITATHDVTKAQQLNNLAINIAAAKGKPLAAVSLALSKAYNGNVGALGRLGIKTKDAKGKALEFTAAQKMLNQQFGGAAAAKAKTFSGVMDRFRVSVNEGGEALGYLLLPQLTKAVPKITKFVNEMQDGTGAGGEFVDEVKTELIPVVKNLSTDAQMLFGTLRPVLELLSKLPPQVVATGGAVGVLGTKFNNLRTPLDASATSLDKFKRSTSNAAGAGGLILLSQGMAQTDQDSKTFQTTLGGLATGFALGGPIGGAVGALGGFAAAMFSGNDATKKSVESLADYSGALDANTGKLKKNAVAQIVAATRKESPDTFKAGEALGFTDSQIAKAISGNKKMQASIDRTLAIRRKLGNSPLIPVTLPDGTKAEIDAVTQLGTALHGAFDPEKTRTSKGLIKDFASQAAEAKRAAKQIQQVNGALKGLPKSAVTKITNDKTGDISLKQIKALGSEYGKTPKQVNTLIKLAGLGDALAELKRLKAAADRAATARQIKFTIKVNNSTNSSLAELAAAGNSRVAGGGFMERLAAQIAKGTPKVKTALDRAKGLFQAFSDKVSSLKETKAGFLSTFSSDSVFGADSDTTGNTLSGLLDFQNKQAQNAKQLFADIKTVTGKGLSKGLVSQLQAAGSAGASQLHLLAGASSGEIKQFNSLNAQTASANAASGLLAGNFVRGGNINADIATAQQQAAMTKAIIGALSHLKLEAKVSGRDIIIALRAEAKSSGVPTSQALTRG